MRKRECTIPLPLGRPRDEWAKCLRDTLFIFAAERRLGSFAMRPLPPDGVVDSGWTVTVEGTDSQISEDSDIGLQPADAARVPACDRCQGINDPDEAYPAVPAGPLVDFQFPAARV
jgi:hypothetical protein